MPAQEFTYFTYLLMTPQEYSHGHLSLSLQVGMNLIYLQFKSLRVPQHHHINVCGARNRLVSGMFCLSLTAFWERVFEFYLSFTHSDSVRLYCQQACSCLFLPVPGLQVNHPAQFCTWVLEKLKLSMEILLVHWAISLSLQFSINMSIL